MTKEHNHIPEPKKRDSNEYLQTLKDKAVNSRDAPRTLIKEIDQLYPDSVITMHKIGSLKQLILRKRRKNEKFGFNAKSIAELVIPDELKVTSSGNKLINLNTYIYIFLITIEFKESHFYFMIVVHWIKIESLFSPLKLI